MVKIGSAWETLAPAAPIPPHLLVMSLTDGDTSGPSDQSSQHKDHVPMRNLPTAMRLRQAL